MYVLMENNKFVHMGPINWNRFMFQNAIKDELNIDSNLPAQYDSVEPIELSPEFKIYSAQIVYPQSHNNKIQQFAGPYWTVVDNIAIGTYENFSKDIDVVKTELKAIVANNRWKLETKGIVINVQGQDVNVTTNRGERYIFLQALQLMSPTDTRDWKFDNTWLTLTHPDLQFIVLSIVNHIQTAFDWDKTKGLEIDAATTLEELDVIVLTTEKILDKVI